MSKKAIRAFESSKYDYYRLTRDFGPLPAGTIFYHDPDDDVYGSIAYGCLKNCWTPDGNCYGGLCGGTVILHYDYANTDWFEKVDRSPSVFEPGRYEMQVNEDGSWGIRRILR